MMRSFPFVALACAAALLLGACSGGSGGTPDTPPPVTSVVVSTGHAQAMGTVLVNEQGFVLYATAREAHGKVSCTGNCASTWPLLTVTSAAAVHVTKGSLVRSSLIGTITKSGYGTIVTYAGYPLHTYVGDAQSAGNGEGIESYFAMGASGALVHPPTPTGRLVIP